jgi:hypothetical protein
MATSSAFWQYEDRHARIHALETCNVDKGIDAQVGLLRGAS